MQINKNTPYADYNISGNKNDQRNGNDGDAGTLLRFTTLTCIALKNNFNINYIKKGKTNNKQANKTKQQKKHSNNLCVDSFCLYTCKIVFFNFEALYSISGVSGCFRCSI